jgi:hypothetical protein
MIASGGGAGEVILTEKEQYEPMNRRQALGAWHGIVLSYDLKKGDSKILEKQKVVNQQQKPLGNKNTSH